ncbi:MAG TPA: fumarylacetoacetase [Rhodoblastus sp.]|nr:fumarylacetoacetase [Rhodoblastus sp.]
MPHIDATHARDLESWVASANGHASFPIQNLPLGVFAPRGGDFRCGVAIGDEILDLRALADAKLLQGAAQEACMACRGATLNAFLALEPAARKALRASLSALLAKGVAPHPELLHRASDCALALPAHIGDYTDLYAGIHHATKVGLLFRPDSPLMPNYKWVPIGYHGRASSVRPSGESVRRPNGQRKAPDAPAPTFGPCERLDFELEMGVWIGGENALGAPVPIAEAADRIAGFCLLNDWSARDVQAWEYQPLGPFLAKSFHTTISPWIVTAEALAPFRAPAMARAADDPKPLPYLDDAADRKEGGLALELEVFLTTTQMREKGLAPHRLCRGDARNLYWTPAQMVAHHTSNGCNLGAGDLLGTGTISAPQKGAFGSLLEETNGGREPITLESGETRTFLQDGDEIVMRAFGRREGFASIGFGECRGAITPAPAI